MVSVSTDRERQMRERELIDDDEKRTREETARRKNKEKFVQMYEDKMVHVRKLIRDFPLAAEVFLFLTEKMDQRNALVCPTQVLSDVFKKSRRQIDRVIKHLKDNDYLYITKVGNVNVYHMNKHIVWKSFEWAKEYCQFEGNILIARSENIEAETDYQKYKHLHVKDAEDTDIHHS
jgi:hypothetical protein